nr:MAG TPA: hypothetical protein [Caudoviricetes sp.]
MKSSLVIRINFLITNKKSIPISGMFFFFLILVGFG